MRMNSHPVARLALSLLAILLAINAAPILSGSHGGYASLLRAPKTCSGGMSSEAADDCTAPAPSASSSADVDAREIQLFEAVRALVADRLNASPPALNSNVGLRAVSALREVEQSSAEINKSQARRGPLPLQGI